MPIRRPTLMIVLALVAGCSTSSSHPPVRAPSQPAPSATTAAAAPVPTTVPTAVATVVATPAAKPSPSSRPPTLTPAADRRRFPISGCHASYGHSHHDYPATDIFAARGCAVLAPATGRVDEVSTVDRWSSTTNRGGDRGGLSFSIVGVDGVRYYGSHLQTLSVRIGQRVRAGEQVGTVGSSGSARGTATHLHFGLSWPTRPDVWWVRRGEVYPWSYLDSWRAGGDKSPVGAVDQVHQRQGDVPPCRIDC